MSAIAFWDNVADPIPGGSIASFLGKTTGLPGTTIGTDSTGRPVVISPEGNVYATSPWDQVWLNNQLLPGVCRVTGQPSLKLDRKKPGGADGLAIANQGYMPGPIDIESLVWTPAQWTQWQLLISSIWNIPSPSTPFNVQIPRGSAIQISGPGLDWLGIGQAVVLGITPPEPGPIRGTRVIKIKAIEFVAPVSIKPKNAKPNPKKVPLDQHLDQKNVGRKPSAGDGGPTGPRPNRLGGAT